MKIAAVHFRFALSTFLLCVFSNFAFAEIEGLNEAVRCLPPAHLINYPAEVPEEQFYLQVGKTLLTRSAEFGLRPDGMVATSVKTEAGETLYIRPMPPYQNNCGFFGLLNHTGTATPRADAVKMLLDHARDASIRALVAPELVEGLLERKDVITLPGGEALSDQFVQAQDDVDRTVRMANTLMASEGLYIS